MSTQLYKKGDICVRINYAFNRMKIGDMFEVDRVGKTGAYVVVCNSIYSLDTDNIRKATSREIIKFNDYPNKYKYKSKNNANVDSYSII